MDWECQNWVCLWPGTNTLVLIHTNMYKWFKYYNGLKLSTDIFARPLTHLPLVPHICVSELGQHWFRWWLVSYSAPIHYLNQCWVIANWTIRNKFKWNFNQNTKLFIHKNVSEDIICKMAAILSRGDEPMLVVWMLIYCKYITLVAVTCRFRFNFRWLIIHQSIFYVL